VSLRSVPGHSSISANEWADEQAAKGASMREVSAGTEISVRTLRRYQEQARKKVKGGVSYHLYKLIVDLKRRKPFNQLCSALMQHLDARTGRFFFRSSNGVRGSLLDICMKTAAARTKAGRSRWQQPGQKPRGWRKTQKSSVEALEQEDPERVISMEAQSITQKFLVKNGDGGLPCKHYACRALRRVRNHWYFIYYPDSDDRSGYFDIAGVREVFAE
ncbi:hypothetical protein FOZ63_008016, partial [Perkinsus olseni]